MKIDQEAAVDLVRIHNQSTDPYIQNQIRELLDGCGMTISTRDLKTLGDPLSELQFITGIELL